ncbi:hypothetical protein [Bacillus mesophilum]|uniref:BppU N-terminal domain-containing protein n=1 Tax=Bacillus mesophilum TaxID=1071718 RepID=A0A7V7RQ91_9BACI|nr:hypothetical protein [Bacillus mesophilum]KAB2335092.1 hypothetical protein F7732_00520 [Bacillus mesophilum]
MRIEILNQFNTLKQGDTKTEFKFKLLDFNDNPLSLEGLDVKVIIANQIGKILEKAPVLDTDEEGVIYFNFDDSDVTGYGDMRLEIHVVDSEGDKLIIPSSGYYKFVIDRNLNDLSHGITSYSLEFFMAKMEAKEKELTEAIDAAVEVTEGVASSVESADNAATAANTQAIFAKTQGEFAQEQGTIAATEAENLSVLKTSAQTATQTALDAATEADQQAFNAENAAQDANNAANNATLQADYAKAQGDIAKTETERLMNVDAAQFDSRLNEVTAQLTQRPTQEYIDTKVEAVASGSPKGTYATLTALQTAYPNGNGNIYVVTADGKWYYWNDTAWVAGAVYQGTISDGMPATNIIKNGDFSNGFTSWGQNTSSNVQTIANNELNITFVGSYGFIYQLLTDVAVGDMIYVKADIKADTTNVLLNMQHKSGVASLEVRHSGSGNYEKLSGIIALPADTNLSYVRARISDYRTSNWTPVVVKNFIVLNLTKVFGAGNEPTKAELEKLLFKYPNGWFDGTKPLYTLKETIDKIEATNASVTQIQNDISDLGIGLKSVYVNYSETGKQFDVFLKSGEDNKFFKTEFKYYNSPVFTDGGTYQNFDLWRLVKGYFGTFNGTTFTQIDEFLNGGAWETAIKVDGYPDFSGTYHGYELMDSITYFVNGIETTFSVDKLFDCVEFEIIYKSRLIKQGTTSEAIANVARHYRFNKDGVTLRQQFKWLQTLTIASGNVAMLSAKRFAVQGNNTSKQITDRIITDFDYNTYDVSQDGHNTPISGKLVNNVHYAKLWGKISGYYADVKVEYDDDAISKKFNVSNSVSYNKLYFSYGDGKVVNANEIWGMKAHFKFRS